MKIKSRTVWELYWILAVAFAVKDAYHLLDPESEKFLFYFILRSFNPDFYLHYGAYVLHVLLNAIHCLPLLFFIYQVDFWPRIVWKLLFVARCVFEVLGHTYDMTALTALYHFRPKVLIPLSLILIIPHIPSYFACYVYAFRPRASALANR